MVSMIEQALDSGVYGFTQLYTTFSSEHNVIDFFSVFISYF